MPRETDSKHTKELRFDATRRNEKSPSSVSLGLDHTSVGHFARTKAAGWRLIARQFSAALLSEVTGIWPEMALPSHRGPGRG